MSEMFLVPSLLYFFGLIRGGSMKTVKFPVSHFAQLNEGTATTKNFNQLHAQKKASRHHETILKPLMGMTYERRVESN